MIFVGFSFSYSMTGKLGGHAGPVMTLLLRETNKESLVFTGSRDHYVKVRKLPDTDAKRVLTSEIFCRSTTYVKKRKRGIFCY